MEEHSTVATTADELRAQIVGRYDSLSNRLQQVARYVLEHPNDLALETLAVMSERSGAQPSAFVRFAQSFGFEGASQMQRLFRDGFLSGHPAAAYGERVREFTRAIDRQGALGGGLLSEFIEGNILGLNNLRQTVSEKDIAAAIQLIEKADTVYVAGFRRSFPVSSYLAYSLPQAGKRAFFVDGVAGLSGHQVQTITSKDLLIAISYHPYAEETVEAVSIAGINGAKVLAITDSVVSPIAKAADAMLEIRESEIRGFRSLSASLCLAQAVVIAFAFNQQRNKTGARRSAPKR